MAKYVCKDCGKEFEEENGRFLYGDKTQFVCDNCFEDGLDNYVYAICEDCGVPIEVENAHDVGNCNESIVCDDCFDEYKICECCEDYFRVDDMERTENGGHICRGCQDYSNYRRCGRCGVWVCEDDAEWSDDEQEYYCEDCYEEYRENQVIHDYHYSHNYSRIFYGGEDNGDNLFMGMELEVDDGDYYNRDDVASKIRDIMPDGFITFENDGSLDEGFENITEPATFEYHQSIKDNYTNMCKIAVDNGFRSHNTSTCGLHVHINRSYFGNDQEERIAKLLYLVEKFWDELVKFSRRRYSQLDQWAKKYDATYDGDYTEIAKKAVSNAIYDRYYAINLTNRNTIEFRLFRGTLKVDTILATLEMVKNIAEFSKNKTIKELQDLTFEELLTSDNLKEYWETRKNKEVRD